MLSRSLDTLTDERVPYVPCWYGAISEIEITDEPDPDEPVDEIQPEVPGDWAWDTTTRPITHIQTPEETAWAINLLRQHGCTFPNFTRSDDSGAED